MAAPVSIPESSKALGTFGERYAADLLEQSGYRVECLPDGAGPGDLAVTIPATGEVLRVEVKTARRGSRGTWQFCLYRRLKGRLCCDYRRADVLLLLAASDGQLVPFVIPVRRLRKHRFKLEITSHPLRYGGWMAAYRQNKQTLLLQGASL